MYYAYIRKLGRGQFIGLCALVNGVMVTDMAALFRAFENVISEMVIKGWLIKFSSKGDIVPNASELYLSKDSVSSVESFLCWEFSSMTTAPLPPLDYARGIDSKGTFSHDDNPSEILKSSYSNAYTYILKSKGYNSVLVSSYKGVLAKVNGEKEKLIRENGELKEELSKQERHKRNGFFLHLLLMFIIGLLAGLIICKLRTHMAEQSTSEVEQLAFYEIPAY